MAELTSTCKACNTFIAALATRPNATIMRRAYTGHLASHPTCDCGHPITECRCGPHTEHICNTCAWGRDLGHTAPTDNIDECLICGATNTPGVATNA